jgi:predicted SAM-dependent methyltransferase
MSEFRAIEIGPGKHPINPAWDTLDVSRRAKATYRVHWGMEPLPIPDEMYDYVFASHAIEHVAWYKAPDALLEVKRILKPEGWLELWMPDGYKIAKAIVELEEEGRTQGVRRDRYWRMVRGRNPHQWVNTRLFAYGDRTGDPFSISWHHALYTPSSAEDLLKNLGFASVTQMDPAHRLGRGHGWIEFGLIGQKPREVHGAIDRKAPDYYDRVATPEDWYERCRTCEHFGRCLDEVPP